MAAAAVTHAHAITVRHRRIGARTAERRQSEQQLQQHDVEIYLQSRRVAFFKERAAMFDEIARLDRFLQHIRATNDYPSNKMHEFLKWAEAYIRDLRQGCNAAAVDSELAESDLFGAADHSLPI